VVVQSFIMLRLAKQSSMEGHLSEHKMPKGQKMSEEHKIRQTMARQKASIVDLTLMLQGIRIDRVVNCQKVRVKGTS
jgi:hypothetical protein